MPAAAAAAVGFIASNIVASAGFSVATAAFAATAATTLVGIALTRDVKKQAFDVEARGYTTMVRSAVEPHKVIYGTRRVSGTLVYVGTSNKTRYQNASVNREYSKTNGALYLVIALAGHEVDAIEKIYFDDIEIPLDSYGNATNSVFVGKNNLLMVNVARYTGTPDQEADAMMVEEIPHWSSAHRLQGVAYIRLRLIYDANAFPTGIPNISALVRGKKLFDPRTNTTSFSDNWALCMRDYLTNSHYGLGCSSDEIDEDTLMAAANISDESVPLKAGGAGRRYTCNGVIDTSKKPLDILQEMATAGAGVVPYIQGKFHLYAGVYTPPEHTLTADWLRGTVQVMDSPSRKEMFNTVRGVYCDPAQLYQPTDFATVSNSFYRNADKGVEIATDIDLPFTVNHEAAQRLAALTLHRARQAIRVKMPCNLKAMQVKVWDTLRVSLPEMGWDEKVFRVTGWQLASDGGVDLDLKEEAPSIYDWDADHVITRDPAADTQLPRITDSAPPGNPTLTESTYITENDGGYKIRATLTWQETQDAFTARYRIYTRYQDESTFTMQGETTLTRWVLNDVPRGLLRVQITGVNRMGVESEPVEGNIQIHGKISPPADIKDFNLAVIDGQAHLSWAQTEDLSVRIGGRIRLRHTPQLAEATWSSSMDITEALSGSTTYAVVPFMTGTYMVKAMDSSGNESLHATTIVTTASSVMNTNVVASTIAEPAFLGEKVGLVFHPDTRALSLNAGGTVDAFEGLFDDAEGLFDTALPFFSEGSYYLAETLDLGTVQSAVLKAQLQATIYDASEQFDENEGLFDDRTGMFDNSDITTVSAELMVRTTDDAPAAPDAVWSPWQKLAVRTLRARGFAFKLDVQSTHGNHNIDITSLQVHIDMPDRTYSGKENIPAGGQRILFPHPYMVPPVVGATLLNANSGDYFTLDDVDSHGFNMVVKNSANQSVLRQMSWIAKGY